MQIIFRNRVLLLISSLLISIGAADFLPVAGQTKLEFEPGVSPQQTSVGDFKVSVNVDLVTADVTVIGAPESELGPEDFIIYDNSVSQQTSYFSRDQLPLAVAVLIDNSGSIEEHLPALKIAAITALRRLKPEDQVALYSFAKYYHRLIDLTEDRLSIANMIEKLKVKTGTDVYSTIYNAAQYLKKNAPNRRRAIILISDNCDLFGGRDADDCRKELLESATTLYNIVTTSHHTELALFKDAIQEIQRLAEETGGEIYDVQGSTSLKAALEKAILRLRMQYTLGFNPSNPGAPGSFHKLTVRFANEDHCPGCQLLARSGYYAGKTAPLPPQDKTRTTPSYSSSEMDPLLVQRSILIAGSTSLDLNEIPFTVSTLEQTDSNGQPQVRVDLQINPAGIDFAALKGLHYCKVTAAIFYFDKGGKGLGHQLRTFEGQLNEENYNRILKMGGIHDSVTIPLKAKNQILKVVVYDEKSDKVGSKLIQLHNTAKQKSSD